MLICGEVLTMIYTDLHGVHFKILYLKSRQLSYGEKQKLWGKHSSQWKHLMKKNMIDQFSMCTKMPLLLSGLVKESQSD